MAMLSTYVTVAICTTYVEGNRNTFRNDNSLNNCNKFEKGKILVFFYAEKLSYFQKKHIVEAHFNP